MILNMNIGLFRVLMVAVLLTVVLHVGVFAKEISDKERNNLTGPVRSVHVESMESSNLSGQLIQTPKSPLSTDTYDERGNLIERVFYSAEGNPSPPMRWGFIYDDLGNILEKRYYNSNDVLVREDLYKYDPSGKPIEKVSYSYGIGGKSSGGGFIGSEKYFYDEKVNLIEVHHLADDRSITNKDLYIYDSKGNRTIEASQSPCCNPSPLKKKVMAYDEKGRVIETEHFSSDGSLLRKSKVSYDSQGNPTVLKSYGSNGSLELKENRFYEYDAIGNWTKSTHQVKYKDPKKEFVSVIFRKIVYYSKNGLQSNEKN